MSVADAVCIHEMTMLLACMKKHEFDTRHCLNEHGIFTNCMQTEMAKIEEADAAARQGLLGVGGE